MNTKGHEGGGARKEGQHPVPRAACPPVQSIRTVRPFALPACPAVARVQRLAAGLALLVLTLSGCYETEPVPVRPGVPKEAGEAFDLARQALREGEADAALACLDTAIEMAPSFAQALVWRGIVREGRGDPAAREDYEKAVACYDSLLEATPRDLDLALDRCVALYLWRGQAEALHAVQAVVEDYPDHQPAASLRERIEKNHRAWFINKVIPDGAASQERK